jgi:hypothetical protein
MYLGRVGSMMADVALSRSSSTRTPCFLRPSGADHALRTREGFDRLDDLVLERTEEHEGMSTSTFTTPKGRFSVSIAIEDSEPAFLTCHSSVEEPAPAYRVISVVPSQP